MVRVLINEAFKKYLLDQPPEYRKKVREKFEFLEIGYWDGGLKVKKIKSLPNNKAVFEARLDRSNRILFTLGSAGETDSTSKSTLIYIWGIVSHDDITTRSRNIPTNVPFLQFKPFQEETIAEVALEDLEAGYFTQESISQKVSDDSASQKWHFLDQQDWQRIEAYRQDDFEMALYLTQEQQEVLNRPLPILVSGTAGSGKTTIGIYYLLNLARAKDKKLFITYNKYLKNSALKLYSGLLNATPLKNEYRLPDFYTFKEYCLKAAEHFHRKFPEEKEINYEKFTELIALNGLAQKFDTPLIWEEIRSMIKGALPQINIDILSQAFESIKQGHIPSVLLQAIKQQFFTFAQMESLNKVAGFVEKFLGANILDFASNIQYYIDSKRDYLLTTLDRTINFLAKERELTQKKYLSLVDYEALGKKKAPNFYLDRKQIYQIFEWYQDQLERGRMWDELDLSREVMGLLSENEAETFQYDLVVCDEIQDLTDIQHELLFYIVKNPFNLLLGGDTKQIINPSGFRWEELKRHFYEREMKIPEIHFLSLNFRSSGSIVELSNTLLALKSSLLGARAEEQVEDWKYKGRPPVVVKSLSEQKMLEQVKRTGAKKTVLVRTEEEKNRLKGSLETELIFTIHEAKGLEFDTVLLWKFTNDIKIKDVWEVILHESNREVHLAKIRHEINLLYVAITRAQKDLLVFDGKEPSLIWKSDLIGEKIHLTDDLNYIGNIWNVISSPEEWREQGDYFFERDYFKAAMECYKNAGEEALLLKATAYNAEKSHNLPLAAISFEKLGMKEKAAIYHEQSGNFYQAFNLWQELKNPEAVSRCHIKNLETEKRFGDLAEIYLSKRDYARAYEMLVKAELFARAAEVSLIQLKNRNHAVINYEKAGMYQEAAALYQKLGDLEKAAVLFEKVKDYENARKLWKRLKRQDRLISLYQQTNDLVQLLNIYERERDFDNSVKTLRKLADKIDLKTEAQMALDHRRYFKALVRFQVLNDPVGLANCHFKLGHFPQAARWFESIGNHYHAGIAYQKSNDFRSAFFNFIQSEEDQANALARARRIIYRVTPIEVDRMAEKFIDQRKYKNAATCYYLIFNYVKSGICYMFNNQPEEALQIWKFCLIDFKMVNAIAKFCIDYNHLEFGARFFLNQEPPSYNFYFSVKYYEDVNLSSFIYLMERYFLNHPNTEEMVKWVDILSTFPANDEIEKIILIYLEKARQFNRYFLRLRRASWGNRTYFRELIGEFEKDYEAIKKDISEISACKLYILKKFDDFNQIVEQLTISEDNLEIFGESDSYDRAVNFLLKKGDLGRVRPILVHHDQYDRLARLLEKDGQIEDAAYFYSQSDDYEKAADLYAQTQAFYPAGEAYFKARNYPRALEMFSKSLKWQNKVAMTLEKMGKYSNAAKIWKQLGKMKNYQRCIKKITGPTLFDDTL